MLFHSALADKIKFKPRALNTSLHLSRVWSLTFTVARCRALCRAPPAFSPGSAGADAAPEVPPRWHGGPREEERGRRGGGFPGRGSEGRLEGLGDGRAARRSGTERAAHVGYGSLRRGRQLGADVVRAAAGRAPSCHRAQAPAGDVTSAEKPQTLPAPTLLPPKG